MTLDDYRIQCGWTKNDMARHAGMDFNTLQKAMRGDVVSIGTAKKIAAAISRELGQSIHFTQIEGLNVKT